jgi:hypothetical protein
MKFIGIGRILVKYIFFLSIIFRINNIRENTFRTKVIINIKIKTKNKDKKLNSKHKITKKKTNKQIIYHSL